MRLSLVVQYNSLVKHTLLPAVTLFTLVGGLLRAAALWRKCTGISHADGQVWHADTFVLKSIAAIGAGPWRRKTTWWRNRTRTLVRMEIHASASTAILWYPYSCSTTGTLSREVSFCYSC